MGTFQVTSRVATIGVFPGLECAEQANVQIARLRFLSPEAFFDVGKLVRGGRRAWQRS